jgi:hypothetical protein
MNLTRFVFWNVNKRDLTHFVCALAESTKADVIILNEMLRGAQNQPLGGA